MKLTPKQSGFVGAAAFLSLMFALLVLAKLPPFDSAIREVSGDLLSYWTYPMTQAWEWLLPKIGFEGERAMIMIFPIIFSWLLYAGLTGFGVGWVVCRWWSKSR